MRSSPVVAVGIPFRNAEKTLEDAIRSIFAQTIREWELFLVDDGSTDRSLEIAQAVRDPRVNVVSDGCNRTLAPRLNQISWMASAPLLARMDADDLMHPTRLEKQVAYLKKKPEVDVVGTAVVSVDATLRPRGKGGVVFHHSTPLSISLRGLFIHPSVTGRTSWFRQNPYCEDDWAVRAEDYELWLRTSRYSVFGHIPEQLLFYREDSGNIKERLETSHRSILQVLERLGRLGLGPVERRLVRFVRSSIMAVTRVALLTGREDWLITRHTMPLSATEVRIIRETIRKILETPVPGLH